MRPAKGAVFSGWKSRPVRFDQPPVAILNTQVVTLRVKQGKVGDRVIRHISPEIFESKFGVPTHCHMWKAICVCRFGKTATQHRGVARSAMSHNDTASTGENLYVPDGRCKVMRYV